MPENLQEKSHLRRYWPRWFLGLSPIVFVATIYFVGTIDIDPPDVSDLVIDRPVIKDAENAYLLEIQLHEDYSIREYSTLIDAVKSGDDFDGEAWESLKSHQGFEIFDKMLSLSSYQAPRRGSFDALFPHFGNTQRWTKLACEKIMKSALSDSEKYNKLKGIESFGYLMRSSANCFIENLVGITLQEMASEKMQQIANSTSDRDLLNELLLKPYDNTDEMKCFRNVFKEEILLLTKSLQDEKLIEGNFGEEEEIYFKSYQYHPNRVAKYSAEIGRSHLSRLVGSDLKLYKKESEQYLEGLMKKDYTLTNQIKPNGMGRVFAIILSSSNSKLLAKTFSRINAVNCLRIAAALRLFYLDKQSYPNNLIELVPNYLPNIPQDVISQDAVNYNPEKGILYCVGTDFSDDGGDEDDIYYFKR